MVQERNERKPPHKNHRHRGGGKERKHKEIHKEGRFPRQKDKRIEERENRGKGAFGTVENIIDELRVVLRGGQSEERKSNNGNTGQNNGGVPGCPFIANIAPEHR